VCFRVSVCVYLCVDVCVCVCPYLRMYFTCVCIYIQREKNRERDIHICVFVCIRVYVCMCMCVYIYIERDTVVCLRVYIFISTYTYIGLTRPARDAGVVVVSPNHIAVFPVLNCYMKTFRHRLGQRVSVCPKNPTRVAAPSPRASLGRRTVCGRTEQRRPPVSKRYESKARMVWRSFYIAAAALKTPTRNGYNAQGVNLTFCPFSGMV